MILRSLTLALCCASLLAVAACTHDEEEPVPKVGFHSTNNRPGAQPTPSTQIPDDGAPPDPTPRPERHTTQIPESTGSNGNTSSGPADYPYGIPVKDKPGFVTSPYAPDSGYVDVHGFATGQEVRDPYTQKIFLVP